MDAAVTEMLLGKDNWLEVFYDKWNKAYSFGKATQIFDNPNIMYSYKDFDAHVLESKDYPVLSTWAKSLNLVAQAATPSDKDLILLYSDIASKKKNPYKKVSSDEMVFFNRASWLSMKRKGKVLLHAFKDQFMPKVKKVLATQERASLTDPSTGDSIMGFVDMVLEIEGHDKPVIFDLKTAGAPYTQDTIDFSEQLTLYCAMKGQQYNTDLVGYVVLCKNIPKVAVGVCKSCGNTKSGRHKTCEAEVNGVRCGGEWDEKTTLAPEVQVLVEKKDANQVNALLTDVGNIILAMKSRVVYRNMSKCTNWYGSPCPFFNACHKNDFSGLVKKNSGGSSGT